MKIRAYLFAALLAFALAGCAGVKKIIESPAYDAQCKPSHDEYLALAQRTDDMAAPGEIPMDPQEALDKANAIVEAKGYMVIKKTTNGPEQWQRFTTTLHGVILLGANWDEKPTRTKAITMWHELVHARQWERLGPETMAIRYAIPEGRWAVEVQAYRESARTLVQWGASDEDMETWMRDRIETLYEAYMLNPMPKHCMAKHSEAAWSPEWRQL